MQFYLKFILVVALAIFQKLKSHMSTVTELQSVAIEHFQCYFRQH